MEIFRERHHQGYRLTDDPAGLDLEVIHAYLSKESYWAKNIPRDVVARSLQNSLCIGVFSPDGRQVGLARVISDYATYAWLCDVFVLREHRGHGLGKALVQMVVDHPRLQGLRRIALGTLDAHDLYAQFGFTPLAEPHRHMERRTVNPYGA